MNTTFGVIALAIVAVAIVLLLSRRSKKSFRSKRLKKALSTTREEERSSTQWRAVKIASGLLCCDAVEKMAGQVFLASESPQLPLEGCSEDDCRCKYVHLEDRRSGGDRRFELGELGAFLPVSQVERRQVGGRRATDMSARI